jgi:hypothetical protein
MSVHVTIETASRAEAELLAALLQPVPKAEAWRGYGVIRLTLRDVAQTESVIETVADGVEQYALQWTRVRYGDEERVFGTRWRGSRERRVVPSPAAWLEADSGAAT